MGSFVRMWVVPVTVVVVCWRALSELVERIQELAATGELARRVEARRAGVLADALVRARVSAPARVPALVGVRVDVSGRLDIRTLASVQVGSIGVVDVDDIGLLEGAMRRAASERMEVAATGVQRKAERRARRAAQRGEAALAADVLANTPDRPVRARHAEPVRKAEQARRAEPSRTAESARTAAPARKPEAAALQANPALEAALARDAALPRDATPAPEPAPVRSASRTAVPGARPPRRDGGWTDWRFLDGGVQHVESVERELSWQLPAVLLGAVLSFAPLVRPLADAAPWLAIAGLALVAAGWLGARRS